MNQQLIDLKNKLAPIADLIKDKKELPPDGESVIY